MVARRDAATQMSPQGSNPSSPREEPLFCPSPSYESPPDELRSQHPANIEIREVQVDKGATMVRRSKRNGSRASKKDIADAEGVYENATGSCPLSWDLSDAATDISKYASISHLALYLKSSGISSRAVL